MYIVHVRFVRFDDVRVFASQRMAAMQTIPGAKNNNINIISASRRDRVALIHTYLLVKNLMDLMYIHYMYIKYAVSCVVCV